MVKLAIGLVKHKLYSKLNILFFTDLQRSWGSCLSYEILWGIIASHTKTNRHCTYNCDCGNFCSRFMSCQCNDTCHHHWTVIIFRRIAIVTYLILNTTLIGWKDIFSKAICIIDLPAWCLVTDQQCPSLPSHGINVLHDSCICGEESSRFIMRVSKRIIGYSICSASGSNQCTIRVREFVGNTNCLCQC